MSNLLVKQYPFFTLFISKIRINFTNFNAIVTFIKNSITHKKKVVINYANAYSLVLAKKNNLLRLSLNKSDIVHPDGIGIWLASKILYKKNQLIRFNWTDYGFDFLEICERNKWKIFFLGSTENILMKAKENLRKKYPQLKLMGISNGYNGLRNKTLIEDINKLNIDILYVGLGTPKQEIWIYNNAHNLNCKVIQAVGDLFSLFAEEKIRGPKLFQKIGLEWFFRLLKHPVKYYRRYIIGIPQFFILSLKEFFNKRSNE